MIQRPTFSPDQIKIVTDATATAEELVSNHYKMSASQWLHGKYDVKTLADLSSSEIADGPFAQVIRYRGQRGAEALGSTAFDFYKICLQDHAILAAMAACRHLSLFPFTLYIVAHELIHIVRFSKFLQNFDATPEEKLLEEHRVHTITHRILKPVSIEGMDDVLAYYARWREPIEGMQNRAELSP